VDAPYFNFGPGYGGSFTSRANPGNSGPAPTTPGGGGNGSDAGGNPPAPAGPTPTDAPAPGDPFAWPDPVTPDNGAPVAQGEGTDWQTQPYSAEQAGYYRYNTNPQVDYYYQERPGYGATPVYGDYNRRPTGQLPALEPAGAGNSANESAKANLQKRPRVKLTGVIPDPYGSNSNRPASPILLPAANSTTGAAGITTASAQSPQTEASLTAAANNENGKVEGEGEGA
jgi:hypothetical protein